MADLPDITNNINFNVSPNDEILNSLSTIVNNFEEKYSEYNYSKIDNTSTYLTPTDYNRVISVLSTVYNIFNEKSLSGKIDLVDYTKVLSTNICYDILSLTDLRYLSAVNPKGSGKFEFNGEISASNLALSNSIKANNLSINDTIKTNLVSTQTLSAFDNAYIDNSLFANSGYFKDYVSSETIVGATFKLPDGSSPFNIEQTIYNSYTNTSDFYTDSNPPGTIIWWSSQSIVNIPTGYVICDGTEYAVEIEETDSKTVYFIITKYTNNTDGDKIDITEFYKNNKNNINLFPEHSPLKFRPPNLLNKFIKGVSGVGATDLRTLVGLSGEAGLPNIKGAIYASQQNNGGHTEGALYYINRVSKRS